ncbi:hypothetical protein [Pseudohoeflea coraliihabitans]|uniref:Uncharacterized protein n=1 Tax=Pseudohoeflea coraliihabitans TaxID=2860393 RepID=A0ABS6WQE3_9HYPH|nr:hypothetical protein [Pseudohoeflea sp. DP4N28-3]MBW3097985.1 hypothetical protein [Pseudohoeflea sp. DP4N28-3]
MPAKKPNAHPISAAKEIKMNISSFSILPYSLALVMLVIDPGPTRAASDGQSVQDWADITVLEADTFYPPTSISGFDEVWGRVTVAASSFIGSETLALCWRPTDTGDSYTISTASYGYRLEDSETFADKNLYWFLMTPEDSDDIGPSGVEFYVTESDNGTDPTCSDTTDPSNYLEPNDAWLADNADFDIFNAPETATLTLPDDEAELFGVVISKDPLTKDAYSDAFCIDYRNTSSPRLSYTWQEGTVEGEECFQETAESRSGYYVYQWETNNPILRDQPGLDEGAGYAYYFTLSDGTTLDNGGYYYTGVAPGTTPLDAHNSGPRRRGR